MPEITDQIIEAVQTGRPVSADQIQAALTETEEVTEPDQALRAIQLRLAVCFVGLQCSELHCFVGPSLEELSSLLSAYQDKSLRLSWLFFRAKASFVLRIGPRAKSIEDLVRFSDLNGTEPSLALSYFAELLEWGIETRDRGATLIALAAVQREIAKVDIHSSPALPWTAWAGLASVLRRAGEAQSASTVCIKIIESDAPAFARVRALTTLGIIHAVRGDFVRAREYLVDGKSRAQQTGDGQLSVLVRMNLCKTYLNEGDFRGFERESREWVDAARVEPAVLPLDSALELSDSLRECELQLAALDVLALFADRDWSQTAGADQLKWIEGLVPIFRALAADYTLANFCIRAISLDDRLKQARPFVLGEEDYQRISRFYELLADLYGELDSFNSGTSWRALAYLESYKEATFSQALPSRKHRNIPKRIAIEERSLRRELALLEAEREQSYRRELQVSVARVRGLERGLGESPALVVPESQRERSREDRISAIKSQLVHMRADPTRELARFTAYLDSDADALSRAVSSESWPPNTVSITYQFDEGEMQISAYVIDARGAIHKWTEEVNVASIRSMLDVLGHFPARELPFIAAQLSDWLLPMPIWKRLKEKDVGAVILSADPRLAGVPWEALGHEGAYLGTHFAVCHTPSLLRTAHQAARGVEVRLTVDRAIIVANPTQDLAGAWREGQRVNDCLLRKGVTTQLLDRCTGDEFARAIGSYPLIHFAGHTNYLKADPASSYFALTDRSLPIHELVPVAVYPDSVFFLSSCESARSGEAGQFREWLGLGAVLLLKGASAVISTNWPVDDSASEEAVALLYQRVLLGDGTVAECLRAIRQELAAQGAPIGQWAAYSVSGQPFLRLSVDKARS